jgi:hypothetical protein
MDNLEVRLAVDHARPGRPLAWFAAAAMPDGSRREFWASVGVPRWRADLEAGRWLRGQGVSNV